ncbi:cytochrome P450 [Salix suchowensis]|nr:cytochrome P450 [Salix suchowensis]
MADIQGYIILFLLWLVSTILVRAIVNKNRTKPRLPPSPLLLIHIFLGSVPCVVASTPETAKLFLRTHENSFRDRPKSVAVDFLTYGSADFSFSPYGPYWKFKKKIYMTEILGCRMLDQLLPVRHEEITQFLQFLLKKANARESIDVGNNDDEADGARNLVHEVAELTGKFNLSDFIWFCKNLDLQGFGKKLKEVHERIIKEHGEVRKIKKETGEGDPVKDLLYILLDISEDGSSEMKLTRDNIMAFILALPELINNPNILERAREEIDSIVGQSRLVQESDIANLPYFQAIYESYTINSYEIPARTRIFVNMWAINRDPNYWENPFEFQPESLAAMIQCFDWKVKGTVDMQEGTGIAISRAHPLICVPVTRLDPFPSF